MSLNEEKILSGKFVFISYSHKDKAVVKEDMESLLALGVRVWFDVNMRLGDDWSEIAARTIAHENCVGVVFYNSADSFISSAVQIEQELAISRAKKGDFQYWSVNLGEKQNPVIFSEALPKAMNEGKYDYMDAMKLQMEMFHNNILCIMRSDSQSAVSRLYNEIAVPFHLIDNEDNFMDDVRKASMASADSGEITLGRYIDKEYFGPEQANGTDDQRFGSALNLIQLNGKRYSTKPLRWKLMYVENGRAVLLCGNVFAQTTFGDGEAFLKDKFLKIAFSREEHEKFGPLFARYMHMADVEKCVAANKESALTLIDDGKLRHWWIDEKGLTVNWKQTYSNDYHYKKGFSIFVKKGLRPILEISSQKFK